MQIDNCHYTLVCADDGTEHWTLNTEPIPHAGVITEYVTVKFWVDSITIRFDFGMCRVSTKTMSFNVTSIYIRSFSHFFIYSLVVSWFEFVCCVNENRYFNQQELVLFFQVAFISTSLVFYLWPISAFWARQSCHLPHTHHTQKPLNLMLRMWPKILTSAKPEKLIFNEWKTIFSTSPTNRLVN